MRINTVLCIIALGSTTFFQSYQAQANGCSDLLMGINHISDKKSDPCFYLGGGVALSQNEYSKNAEAEIFPTLSLAWDLFYWDDTEIGVYFMGDSDKKSYWSLAALLQSSERGYDPDDEDEDHLKGLPRAKSAFEGGIKFNAGNDWGGVQIKFAHDLEDTHEGYSIDINYVLPFMFGELSFTPVIGLTYYDKKNSNYYYGITEEFATPSRPAYKLKETTNTYAGYTLLKPINKDWAWFHALTVTQVDDEIKDSPIVVSDNISAAYGGIIFKF